MDATIDLKLECEQPTGSFKVRGAFNKLLALKESNYNEPVITASTGNHALAVAYAMKLAPDLAKDKTIIINLSGRGDKDIDYVVENYGKDYGL